MSKIFFVVLLTWGISTMALTLQWMEGRVSRQVHTKTDEKIQIGIHDGVYHLKKANPQYDHILDLLKSQKNQSLFFQVDPLTLEIVTVKTSAPTG